MKRFLSLILTLSLMTTMFVSTGIFISAESAADDFTYTVNEDGNSVTITGYSGSSTDIIIPDSIDGKTVTAIGNDAFYYCHNLVSIIIPDGITSIGSSAFYGCSKLESIIIPEGITSISDSTFTSCISLSSVSIPVSVTTIGDSAFSSCDSLISIQYSGTKEQWDLIVNKDYISIGDVKVTFSDGSDNITSVSDPADFEYTVNEDENTITITGYTGKDIYVVIPDTIDGKRVTIIGEQAFAEKNILTVKIPDGVTNIGVQAFGFCQGLTMAYIPSSVTTIGRSAFIGCHNLITIEIPEGIVNIDKSTFFGCSDLSSIVIPQSITAINESAFFGCDSLKHILYTGTASQWEDITIDSFNDPISQGEKSFSYDPNPFAPGDINSDGTVNTKDLTRLMKIIAGENVIILRANIKWDEQINTKDLTRLMKLIAGEEI